ncbi:hypothetical protein BHE74_00023481, partial [Ensete ventricosum]
MFSTNSLEKLRPKSAIPNDTAGTDPPADRYGDRPYRTVCSISLSRYREKGCDEGGGGRAAMNKGRERREEKGLSDSEGGRGVRERYRALSPRLLTSPRPLICTGEENEA